MKAVPKPSILIVDDERLNLLTLSKMLSAEYSLIMAKNGDDAVTLALQSLPDLILLDTVMPEQDGFAVLETLKRNPCTRDIPVIMMAGQLTSADESKGYYAGASDFLHKPFTQPAVQARVRTGIRLVHLERQVEELTMTDNVTGLPNKRSFLERMAIEWPRAVREKQFVSYLLINVDDYDQYEEAYGHAQAAKMLLTVSKSFTRMIRRATDMVARLNNDDFAAILPHTDLVGAYRIAEALRERIETLKIATDDGTLTTTTISIGLVSSTPAVGDKADWMYEEAARLLSLAQENGKNRVEFDRSKLQSHEIEVG